MYKRIKEELFFLKKLLKSGYGPVAYFRYFKHKFFWKFSISRISEYKYEADPDFELHALCRKKDIGMLAWSLASFLHHSGLRPVIIIHDDGSIDKPAGEILKSKFSALEILFRPQADKLVQAAFLPENVTRYRREGHNLILKLIDIFLFSEANKVMVLDSDVLFFNRPQEIIDFVDNKITRDALVSRHGGTYDLMVSDWYARKHRIVEGGAPYINSGLMLYKKDSLRLEQLYEYLGNTTRPIRDYWIEMAGWGSLMVQTDFEFLPMETYIVKGRPNDKTIMKHFTSPRRQELYAYGIDIVEKIIGNYGSK